MSCEMTIRKETLLCVYACNLDFLLLQLLQLKLNRLRSHSSLSALNFLREHAGCGCKSSTCSLSLQVRVYFYKSVGYFFNIIFSGETKPKAEIFIF